MNKAEKLFHKNTIIPSDKNSCWIYTKGISTGGYGNLKVGTKLRPAHRFSYELFKGAIPKGLIVCHKCDNPCCVNPEHLFVGTHKDNNDDKMSKGRGAYKVGSAHAMAKLSEQEVIEIRTILANSNVSMPKLAIQYNVSYSTIQAIKQRRIWKHLTI